MFRENQGLFHLGMKARIPLKLPSQAEALSGSIEGLDIDVEPELSIGMGTEVGLNS